MTTTPGPLPDSGVAKYPMKSPPSAALMVISVPLMKATSSNI
jgi:hypothetical protein